MNIDTLANCSLDERTDHLVRLAALVTSGAPPMSYLVNIGAAADGGTITAEDTQGVLVALAPITGTPRVTAAAGNILRALGAAEAIGEA